MELLTSISVGTRVATTRDVLGNATGTLGVCYEVYELGGRLGYSFIFYNGKYDGFSPEEVEQFLVVIDVVPTIVDYKFKNALSLWKDFNTGRFNDAFNIF